MSPDVYPDMVGKMAAHLRARQDAGGYDRVTSAEQFAEVLTQDLQAASGDKHLIVEFSPAPLAADMPSVPPETPINPEPVSEADAARVGHVWRGKNCMFVNVAALPGNIGYLKFNAFLPPASCGETASAAMRFVADCAALIIDLRDNTGGDPAMVAFRSLYLFSGPVHLDELDEPRADVTGAILDDAVVPGRKFLGKSVFVLTSNRTFSAAEAFAYSLQMLKRATIVGETSGGGAHAALPLRIDPHFRVALPFARSINPISGTNWEGRGVTPDISTKEEVAVQSAYGAALAELLPGMPPSKERDAIKREIDALAQVVKSKR